jgi:hypothetical protein
MNLILKMKTQFKGKKALRKTKFNNKEEKI